MDLLRDQRLLVPKDDEDYSVSKKVDRIFLAQKLQMVFRHASKSDQGCMGYFWAVIDFPLNLMRDLTIPAGDLEKWDRTKMSLVPVFFPVSLFFLFG
jgi:hypothetical protein